LPDDGLASSSGARGTQELSMSSLRVYHLARELVRAVQPLLPYIARRSRNLADQLERSSLSCPSNIAEAEHRFDGNGRLRLETAFGSAKETRCHLELAVDLGCVPEAKAAPVIDLADHLAASLYRLLARRRP
jgi:four helix bundle protein